MYRAHDENREYAREIKALQGRLNYVTETIQPLNFANPMNQEWNEAMKKLSTLTSQVQNLTDSITETGAKPTFATRVFAPTSFQPELLHFMGIRPSRDIENQAMKHLQQYLDSQASVVLGQLESSSGIADDEDEENHFRPNASSSCSTSTNNSQGPQPWTAKQRKTLDALDFDVMAAGVDNFNATVWTLHDLASRALPPVSGDDSISHDLSSARADQEHQTRVQHHRLELLHEKQLQSQRPLTERHTVTSGSAASLLLPHENVQPPTDEEAGKLALLQKKRKMLAAMFQGKGCRPVPTGFGYSAI